MKGNPFITGMDLIGAMAPTDNFVVCGNNEESLFGVCESMYKPDLEPEELFEVIAQCILAGVNRDCLSGWGGVVHVISKDKVITRTLKRDLSPRPIWLGPASSHKAAEDRRHGRPNGLSTAGSTEPSVASVARSAADP